MRSLCGVQEGLTAYEVTTSRTCRVASVRLGAPPAPLLGCLPNLTSRAEQSQQTRDRFSWRVFYVSACLDLYSPPVGCRSWQTLTSQTETAHPSSGWLSGPLLIRTESAVGAGFSCRLVDGRLY